MSEGENFELQEFIPTREQVIEVLKEKGARDPQAIKFRNKWLGAREKEVDASPDKELPPAERVLVKIYMMLELIEVYRAAECWDDWWDTLNDAEDMAYQFYLTEMYELIKKQREDAHEAYEQFRRKRIGSQEFLEAPSQKQIEE